MCVFSRINFSLEEKSAIIFINTFILICGGRLHLYAYIQLYKVGVYTGFQNYDSAKLPVKANRPTLYYYISPSINLSNEALLIEIYVGAAFHSLSSGFPI